MTPGTKLVPYTLMTVKPLPGKTAPLVARLRGLKLPTVEALIQHESRHLRRPHVLRRLISRATALHREKLLKKANK